MDTRTILVIEDDELLGDLLVKQLTAEGYAAHLIDDGQEGYEYLREHQPDLLLLDLILPSLNGYEILQKMQDDGMLPRVPVIIISNSGEPVQISRALSLGISDYIVKADLSVEEVVGKVKVALGGDTVASQGTIRVLVVEDDPDLRDLVHLSLREQKDMEVQIAETGEAALGILQTFTPDIALIDVLMPGMDGFELLQQIRHKPELQKTACIMFTNLGQDEDKEKAEKYGADDFMVKADINIGRLGDLVRERVAAKRKATGAQS